MSSHDVLPTGVYYIQNVSTDLVIDLPDGDRRPRIPLRAWTKYELGRDTDAPEQLWVIACKSAVNQDAVYTIQNASSRTYAELTILTGQREVHCNLPTGAPSQQWKISRKQKASHETSNFNPYFIQNVETKAYVTLDNTKALIVGSEGSDSAGDERPDVQLWKIIPV